MEIPDIFVVIANDYKLTMRPPLLEPVYLQDGNMTKRQRRRHEATRKKKGRR